MYVFRFRLSSIMFLLDGEALSSFSAVVKGHKKGFL